MCASSTVRVALYSIRGSHGPARSLSACSSVLDNNWQTATCNNRVAAVESSSSLPVRLSACRQVADSRLRGELDEERKKVTAKIKVRRTPKGHALAPWRNF